MAAVDLPPVGIGRFGRDDASVVAGLLCDGFVYPINGSPDGCTRSLLGEWDSAWPMLERRIAAIRASGEPGIPVGELSILPPVEPRQILCVGANYRRHVVEIMADHEAGSMPGLSKEERRARAEKLMDHRASRGSPFAFVKPFNCLAGAGEALVLPADSDQVDWELELAVVIGRPARRVSREDAMAHVAGYTIANDISVRDHISRPDIPNMGLDWIAGKSGPGMLPLGPVIVPAALIPDPYGLRLTLRLNGQPMQDDTTGDMIFDIARVIEFLSTHMQLLPGDVICTGSPAGNATHYGRFLRDGDLMQGSIAGLGAQHVACVAERIDADAARHRPFAPLGEA
jgi:2-keto-4-pentenoate hydratase/2-oxohepta-3-ene-1,7-dioic acid hydratase in catechol pathway